MTKPQDGHNSLQEPEMPRPDFENPPVVEVALSVQFLPLSDLRTAHIGLLWEEEYKDRYPRVEDQPPLDPAVEILPGQEPPQLGITLEISGTPPLRRCWFLNQEKTRLIQVQRDRFIYNWLKKDESEKYPRYPKVFKGFQQEFTKFSRFLSRERLGELKPVLCDITYVNPLQMSEQVSVHESLDRLLTVFAAEYSKDPKTGEPFLGKPESVQMAVRYIIRDENGNAIGRLHVTVDPVFHADDRRTAYMLKLTSRGRPLGEGSEGIYRFFDEGRDWIVRGFHALTTQEMHRKWGIKNDNH